MKATYTYAILHVNAKTYNDVKARLLAAGSEYADAVHSEDGDETIDMHGIAIQIDEAIESVGAGGDK